MVRRNFVDNYLNILVKHGFLFMTLEDKPNSKNTKVLLKIKKKLTAFGCKLPFHQSNYKACFNSSTLLVCSQLKLGRPK